MGEVGYATQVDKIQAAASQSGECCLMFFVHILTKWTACLVHDMYLQ